MGTEITPEPLEHPTNYLYAIELAAAEAVLKLLARNPKTFNQKILYKAAYDRRPILTTFADKLKIRDYVSETVGEKYLTKLYASGNCPAEINFDELPKDYVFKVNHGSGGLILVSSTTDSEQILPKAPKRVSWGTYEVNTNNLNQQRLIELGNKWLSQDYYYYSGCLRIPEWAYKNIERKYLIEELLVGQDLKPALDLKFHMFNGKCVFVNAIKRDLGTGLKNRSVAKSAIFSPEWKRMPIRLNNLVPLEISLGKPEAFAEMIKVAETLAGGIDYVRVDLYNPEPDRIIVGELTNYPMGGRQKFEPKNWDHKLGERLQMD